MNQENSAEPNQAPPSEKKRSPSEAGRFRPVDTLRGFAVLGMSLSGMVAWNELPAWMYHAQSPPPTREFNPTVYGITWVDLVFPFFLLSMGMAIPFALTKAAESGLSTWKLIGRLLQRGTLLFLFAVLCQHFRPNVLASKPDQDTFLWVLGGFFAMVFAWVRPPKREAAWAGILLNAVGFAAAAALLWNRTFPDGTAFRWDRSDIILVVLANVAVSGGLVWWLTRLNPMARMAVFGLVGGYVVCAPMGGIAKAIWDWHPNPIGYFFQSSYHKYLLIVLPGTFIGDRILRAKQEESIDGDVAGRWPAHWFAGLLFLSIVAMAGACVGLLGRDIPATVGILGSIAATLLLATYKPVSAQEKMLRDLVGWGIALLAIGLMVEPVDGGIRKDYPTLSYYFVTAGLGTWFVVGLTAAHASKAFDVLLSLVRRTGENPILAYACITALVPAIAGLGGLESWVGTLRFEKFGGNPWTVVAWGGVKTLFIACICALFARFRVYLRA